jgi:tetratricopeptide (TPR) repeat protein
MKPGKNFDSKSGIILLILLILSFAILSLGEKIIENNWGIGQTALFSMPLFAIWIISAIAILVLMFFELSLTGVFETAGEFLWGKRKLFGRAAFLLISLAIFILLRFEAHLWGNGYIRISNLAQTFQPVLKWYEYGSTFVPYIFYSIVNAIGIERESSAELAYQIVSFLSGISFIIIAVKIAEELFKENYQRLLFLGLVLFSGLSLFFFGMVENAPILLPLLGLFLLVSLKLNQTKNRIYLFFVWGAVILGIFFHIQFLAIIPAALFMTISHFPKNSGKQSPLVFFIPIISIIGGLIALYVLSKSDIGIADKILFLSGKLPEADYSLFSLRHIMDIINLLFLLSPLFLIYLFGIMQLGRRKEGDSYFYFLMITSLSLLTLLFIIDSHNGTGRDINNFALPISGLIFWGAYSLAKANNILSERKGWLIPAAIVLVLPTFIIHLSPNLTTACIDRYLTYNEYKYESALLAFRDYYYINKDYTNADQREGQIISKVKGALESQLVNDLYYRERFSDAFDYANRLVQKYPYNATYRMQKGNMFKYYKKYEEAEQELKMAIALEPYRVDLYHFLIDYYRERGNETNVQKYAGAALAIDPYNTIIMIDLLGYYYRGKQDNAADSLADEVLKINNKEAYPFMFKGLIAERNGRYKEALNYYEQFVKIDEKLPDVPIIRKRLNNLFLMLNDSTKSN